MLLWVSFFTILSVFILVIKMFLLNLNKDDPLYVMKFIKEKKDKKAVSLVISRNQTIICSVNSSTYFPLASTVKIIIAIEYARQVSKGIIDEHKIFSHDELQKYYIKNTDGGAHERWLHHFNNKKEFTLREIAIGMIAFSSNANTEFLLRLLGQKNINSIPEQLNLEYHTTIYPIVSSLYIPNLLRSKEMLHTKQSLLNRLNEMSQEEYINYALQIHQQISNHIDSPYLKEPILIDEDFQRVWSERLPASTARDYLRVMQLFNNRNYFDLGMQKHIDDLMEYALMLNEQNRKWLKHAGRKGGSTLFILTQASYATDKQENATEIVFFSNNLDKFSRKKLENNLNKFTLKILVDDEFRDKLRELNVEKVI